VSYRAIFWRPKSGIDPWLKVGSSTERLGEALFRDVRAKKHSAVLENIPVETIIAAVHQAFPETSTQKDGFSWDDNALGGFIVTWSPQHVSFCCFDLVGDDVLERIFAVMEPFNLPHYDR